MQFNPIPFVLAGMRSVKSRSHFGFKLVEVFSILNKKTQKGPIYTALKMKTIPPQTLYETQELRDLLRGVVKIETLRKFGLVGSPGSGYWSKNIVDALNNYWDNLARQRGTGKVADKENHLEPEPEIQIFENRQTKVQNRKVHPSSGGSKSMESQRERFKRFVSKNSV